ncbi:hypothetical protein [Microbacterium allomyrinae]|uniref:hypothetical protein n=1 Tax=Microbacterium allomyrinae TaxID=2830666 RepID=UPI003FD6CF3C
MAGVVQYRMGSPPSGGLPENSITENMNRLDTDVLPTETGQSFQLFLHECQPLRSAPPLNLLLPPIGIGDSIELFEVEQPHRKAGSRVRRALPVVVLRQTAFQLAGTADVEGTIGAFKNAHERHPSSSDA